MGKNAATAYVTSALVAQLENLPPAAPCALCLRAANAGPATSARWRDPAASTERRDPADSTDKRAPADMTENRAPAESTEKAEQKLPIDPIEKDEPIEPMEHAEPMEPTDKNEPLQPMDKKESVDQSDHPARLLIVALAKAVVSWSSRIFELMSSLALIATIIAQLRAPRRRSRSQRASTARLGRFGAGRL